VVIINIPPRQIEKRKERKPQWHKGSDVKRNSKK
jgi:hypothetical protein